MVSNPENFYKIEVFLFCLQLVFLFCYVCFLVLFATVSALNIELFCMHIFQLL